MEPLTFGRWSLRCDRDATQRAYASMNVGNPEICGCVHCRNFVAVREQAYPPEVRGLLTDLGIDFRREAEVYYCAPKHPRHLYGGWFHCVGELASEGEEIGKFDLESGKPMFALHFHDKPNLVPDCFNGLPLLQLEFYTHVPWVLPWPDIPE